MERPLSRLVVVRDEFVADAQHSSPIFRKPRESDDPRLMEDDACVSAHQTIHYSTMKQCVI